MTYRYHGHYGADNPLGYRTEEEETYYKDRDCIDTMAKFLLESGVMTQQEMDEIDRVATGQVEEASRFAVESPYPDPSEILSDVYVKYPLVHIRSPSGGLWEGRSPGTAAGEDPAMAELSSLRGDTTHGDDSG